MDNGLNPLVANYLNWDRYVFNKNKQTENPIRNFSVLNVDNGAFDTLVHSPLPKKLENYKLDNRYLDLLREQYAKLDMEVRVNELNLQSITTSRRTKKSYLVSPSSSALMLCPS